MKKVSVITVNYNQPQVTEALLQSISDTNTYADTEVIVVDNGSSVNYVPSWSNRFPLIKFIRSEVNLGFAGGNNLGIRAASGDYLFLVNNDTEFTENLIGTLVETLENNPHAGIVSPQINYYAAPDVIQYAGFTAMNFYTARNASPGQFEKDTGQFKNRITSTGFAHGAAMMLRRTALEKTGLMYENYFLYYEEMDWCERFKRKGYQIMINTNALIYHKESVSVGAKSALKEYFMNRNRILFIRRNASALQTVFFYFYFILLIMPRNILVYIKDRNYSFIPVLLRAVWWNFTHPVNSRDLGYPLNSAA